MAPPIVLMPGVLQKNSLQDSYKGAAAFVVGQDCFVSLFIPGVFGLVDSKSMAWANFGTFDFNQVPIPSPQKGPASLRQILAGYVTARQR